MRTIPIPILIACHLLALALLALPGCGGGGDAYTPVAMPVATQPAPDPKDCTALVKLGGESPCPR